MAESVQLRLLVIQQTCGHKCMGHSENRGGCCKLGQRDWIIGPVNDVDALLERLSKVLERPVLRSEVVIDFEEGRKLFPERKMWQNPAHFPAMRSVSADPYACRYYDEERGCTIHDIRPNLCRSYECEWLSGSLDRLF